jgi:hypothetical protein
MEKIVKTSKNTSKNRYTDPITGKFIKDNPGKPLGTKNHDTEIQEAINKYAKLNGIPASEVELRMNMTMVKNILSDNYSYFKDWKDRKWGKPKESVDITTGGDKITTNAETAALIKDFESKLKDTL